MKNKKEKLLSRLFLVGKRNAESTFPICVCSNWNTALKEFEGVRKTLLKEAKERKTWNKEHGFSIIIEDLEIEKLKEKNPEKINNYPNWEPFIKTIRFIED